MKDKSKQLIFAIGLAIVAFVITKTYISSVTDKSPYGKTIAVVRSKKSISAGAILSEKHLERVKVPERLAPRGRILWKERERYKGLQLAQGVLPKDYVVENNFAVRHSVGRKLSEQVTGDKYRAISLPVDETNSLARSIVPGDHVDIIYTFSVPYVNRTMSVVLLQYVDVISTGRYSIAEQEGVGGGVTTKRYSTLTLRVLADDAVRLNYARQNGKINVMLRNEKDSEIVKTQAITGILDVLAPEDKARVDELLKEAKTAVGDGERFKSQLKEIFEQQRKQKRR